MEAIVSRLQQLPYFGLVSRLAIILVGLTLLILVVQFLKRRLSRRIRDKDLRYRTRKSVEFVAYVVGVLVILAALSERLTGLSVTLGIVGAGVALALQEVIISIAGFFAITLAGFYKPGDRVRIGGIRGDVIDVSLIRTTLMEIGDWVDGDLYNGRVVRVTNSFVFKEPVYNYSAEFPFLWDEIQFPVRYGSDYRLTRKVMQEVAEEVIGTYSREAEQSWSELVRRFLVEKAPIAPLVTIRADQNWVTFTLRYVVDYKLRRSTQDRLFTRLLEEVDRAGGAISIATASQEITVGYRHEAEGPTSGA